MKLEIKDIKGQQYEIQKIECSTNNYILLKGETEREDVWIITIIKKEK